MVCPDVKDGRGEDGSGVGCSSDDASSCDDGGGDPELRYRRSVRREYSFGSES